MNILTSQAKTNKFVNILFINEWFKVFITVEIIWTLACRFMHYYIISYLVTSLIIAFSTFWPLKLLKSEMKKFINEFYNNNKRSNKALSVICHLKKLNGPIIGVLTLNGNSLSFTPFKENFKKHKFIINNIKKSNVDITGIINKRSWINDVFFKENLYCLDVKWTSKKVTLQMPDDENNKVLFETLSQ